MQSRWGRAVSCVVVLLAAACGASAGKSDGGGGTSSGGASGSGGGSSGGSSGGGLPVVGDCATAPEPSDAVTYVCDCQAGARAGCRAGDDGDPGTRERPLRSWRAAHDRFGAMPAGGTIALCKGGAWIEDGPGFWANTRCSAASPCTIREYRTEWGGDARPLVQHSPSPTTTLLYFGNTHGQSGYRVWNLALSGAGVSAGIAFWDELSDVDLCNLDISRFNLGVYPAGGPDGGPGLGYIQQRVTLRSSYLHENGNVGTAGGWGGGLGWLGACAGCVIDGNLFENNGATPSGFAHQIYLSGPPGGVPPTVTGLPGMKVTNNRIWTHDAACGGVRMVVHEGFDGLLVENNLFETVGVADALGGCWAFSVSPGNMRCPVEWSNLVFRRNRVVGTHGNTPLSVTGTTSALFEDNVVVEGNAGAVAFQIPGQARVACPQKDAGLYPANTGTVIRNNTIHLKAGGTGIRFGIDEGAGHVVANNAILSPAASSCVSTIAPLAFDDVNWCGSASPFVDAAAGDYRPLAGGPLVGAGSSTYASTTAIGTATWSASDAGRERTGAIDIGAFQR